MVINKDYNLLKKNRKYIFYKKNINQKSKIIIIMIGLILILTLLVCIKFIAKLT